MLHVLSHLLQGTICCQGSLDETSNWRHTHQGHLQAQMLQHKPCGVGAGALQFPNESFEAWTDLPAGTDRTQLYEHFLLNINV